MPEAAVLAVGTPAPTFKLPASTGDTIDLAQFKGKQTVVLYFYPKADTPGCTKEACGFRDALGDYDKAKVAVLGVSPDPVKAVTKFGGKITANFPLLADEDHAVCEKYGVWQEKSMYGKKYMGVARTTFVIGTDGRIAHVFEKVKPEGHDQEVLAWIKGSSGESGGAGAHGGSKSAAKLTANKKKPAAVSNEAAEKPEKSASAPVAKAAKSAKKSAK
jgi:peroxiredoxin Q/BCP